MGEKRYLTSHEAVQALNVSSATLYSYVSRGLIRSEASGVGRRTRRYHSEDIKRLQERKKSRSKAEVEINSALHAEDPVLETAITLITDSGLYYRGHDVLKLATSQSFERVSAMIWTGNPKFRFSVPKGNILENENEWSCFRSLRPVDRFQALLPLAEAEDFAAYNFQPESVAATGMRILWFMTRVITGENPVGGIALALRRALSPDIEAAAQLINTALVLLADHELNISTLSARCAASAGATPYSAVCAGLATVRGHKQDTVNERVDELFKEVESCGAVQQTIVGRIRRGERVPGFGHTVSKDADPRAILLLKILQERCPGSKQLQIANEIIDITHVLISDRYNMDFALAVLARVLKMPEGSGIALFTLARTAGWIGHVLEQYGKDQLIRPRAKYIGPIPPDFLENDS